MRQISRTCSRNGRFSFATSEGFVVTPSSTPRDVPWRISSRFAVSRKIFMGGSPPAAAILPKAGERRKLSTRRMHHVSQRANPFDRNLDHVMRDERANARRRARGDNVAGKERSEEHTSELQSLAYLVCRLLLEKKKQK